MRRCRPLLGTFVEIDCDDVQAIDAGFAAVGRVHDLMSAHDPDSELSLVNRLAYREPVEVSEDTVEVIARALHWSHVSGGAFDVVRAGREAVVGRRLPRHHGQPRPDDAADWRSVKLDCRTVSLTLPACLDLGGIAKGHAVDQAVAAMQGAGATAGLVNAGGDMRAFGHRGRPVTVVEPRSRAPRVALTLRSEALATSAGLPERGTLSFDHLTGTQSEWTSVTVRAGNACDADALAKIVWALGRDSAPILAEPRAEAFAIRGDGALDQIRDVVLAS